jgi:prepilin-type processing-associated H-X9-DG protein
VTEGVGNGYWEIRIADAPQKDLLFAGHFNTSNYLFADSHVKALRPRATLAQQDGGSNPVNPWLVTNKTFTQQAAEWSYPQLLTDAQAFIASAENRYK